LEDDISSLDEHAADHTTSSTASAHSALFNPTPSTTLPSKSTISNNNNNNNRSRNVIANLNSQLLALGCRPLFDSAVLSDELLTCVSELLLVAKQRAALADGSAPGATAAESTEGELRALRLDKKSLSASLKTATATLESERITAKTREKAAAATLERANADRDEALRQNALLKSREEQWSRELKRREQDNATLRDRIRKLLDGAAATGELAASHADVVGDVRHTPMKQRAADQLLTGTSVALQRQLADTQAELLVLRGERNALRDELREIRSNK
jgi:hypothetical protein